MLHSTVCRGLKNQGKRRCIFSYLKDKKCHCYFLRDTYSEPKDELIWSSDWAGNMLSSHGTNRQKGVCILLNPSTCNFLIESRYSDVDGQIVLVNIGFLKIPQKSHSVIFTPQTILISQAVYFNTEWHFMSKCKYKWTYWLILGWDWNVALGAITKAVVLPLTSKRLLVLSREFELVDIFIVKNPNGTLMNIRDT